MIADTFQIVPSGLYHVNRPPGTVSYAFLWSYPNLVSSLFLPYHRSLELDTNYHI